MIRGEILTLLKSVRVLLLTQWGQDFTPGARLILNWCNSMDIFEVIPVKVSTESGPSSSTKMLNIAELLHCF